MSKEATGQMGAKIGSSEYWSAINKNTLFGSLMDSGTDYQATIGQLGTKAAAGIEKAIAYIERSRFSGDAAMKLLQEALQLLYIA